MESFAGWQIQIKVPASALFAEWDEVYKDKRMPELSRVNMAQSAIKLQKVIEDTVRLKLPQCSVTAVVEDSCDTVHSVKIIPSIDLKDFFTEWQAKKDIDNCIYGAYEGMRWVVLK